MTIRAFKKSLFGLATIGMAAGVISSGAAVGADDSPALSAQAPTNSKLAILRELPPTALPTQVRQAVDGRGAEVFGPDSAAARRTRTSNDKEAYVVPGQHGVCLAIPPVMTCVPTAELEAGRAFGFTVAPDPTDRAARGGNSGSQAGPSTFAGPATIFGIAPDGNSSIEARDGDGHVLSKASIKDNVYEMDVPSLSAVEKLTLRDPAGRGRDVGKPID